MSQNTQDFLAKVNMLKTAFPNMTDGELASIALGNSTSNSPAKESKTVLEIVNLIRAEYMDKELTRIRVKKNALGEVAMKDTTTYRTYETHWKRIVASIGNKKIEDVTKADVEGLAKSARVSARAKNDRDNLARVNADMPRKEQSGNRSFNLCLDAISAIFRKAIDEELVTVNQSQKVKRAKVNTQSRYGLSSEQLEEILETALTGGDDPILDHLILWTLAETAGRRGGVLKLLLGDINQERQTIMLYEKGDTSREQPVTKELMDALLDFAQSRGTIRTDEPVFRYLPNALGYSSPLTAKRFETMWRRIHKELPWTAKAGVSSHWLRHTILTFVDRAFNQTVARGYAGHSAGTVTEGYSTPIGPEIMRAHSVLTGRLHPLAKEGN